MLGAPIAIAVSLARDPLENSDNREILDRGAFGLRGSQNPQSFGAMTIRVTSAWSGV